MKEGADVRGYIVWGLMDSFDWMEGYDFEYGVYSVDRKTQERTLKPGTEFLSDAIKSHNKIAGKDLASKKANNIKKSAPVEFVCDKACCETKIATDNSIKTKLKIENKIFGECNSSEDQGFKKYSKKDTKKLDIKLENNFCENIKVVKNSLYTDISCFG